MPTADLFPGTKPPRAKPRVLMHVSDAGQVHSGASEDLGKPICMMTCTRCGKESDWLIFDTVTEAKRGIPCDDCNATPIQGQPAREAKSTLNIPLGAGGEAGQHG